MADLSYPLINGRRYSFASIQLQTPFIPFALLGFKSINYKHNKSPGILRGTASQKLGRTQGDYDASGDFEIGRAEWDLLISAINTYQGATAGVQGRGFMDVVWTATVTYADLNSPTVTDTLVGVLITETDHSNSQSPDPTVIKCSCDIMYILENGVPAIDNLRT